MPRPKIDREKLTLRLPRELHAWLVEAARQEERSLNAEIIRRLRVTFD